MRTKTLGQIAHETGERVGSWLRKWEHMHQSQRMEWEAIADAVAAVVAAEERERCARIGAPLPHGRDTQDAQLMENKE